MKEIIKKTPTSQSDSQLCSNCEHSQQIASRMMTLDIVNEDEREYFFYNPTHVGTVRKCFTIFQRRLREELGHFVYPDKDDSCINPKRFKLKKDQG